MGFGKSLKSEGKKKKEGRYDGSGFTWFETSVNGGVHVLQILKQVAAKTPIPYLTQAAGAALVIIQIAQNVKDNKGDFRRLSQDAAALVAAVIESQQKSDDPARWPGAKLENVVQDLVATLESIAAFAEKQEKRKLVERVLNSTADGNKIKEFRERLVQAMSRFELSAHLQTYEILRLMEPMMKEFVGTLEEDAKIEKEGREQEIIEAQRLEENRREQLRLADRLTQEREAAGQNERERMAAEKRAKEREVAEQREQERETVKARVQTILQVLEEEEGRKELLEERKRKAQEEGAAENHRLGLGSSRHRHAEPVNYHRKSITDSEGEEVQEEDENVHHLVKQRKKKRQELAVEAEHRPQKNRRQPVPAKEYREYVDESESTGEEERRYEPVRERKKGLAEERHRTELGRKDRERASKNRKPEIESENEEEEESRQRPRTKEKARAAKESRRVGKSRKHETEEEEESEEESESGSSEEDLITKAAMAGVAAKLERKTKRKDDLQSHMGRLNVDPSGSPWPQPQAHPPSFGYQPWPNHPLQQFGGPPAGPNNWKLRNSKVSSSNDNNNYSTNYHSNNAHNSNQENVGNDHSVTITKVKKTGKRY